MRQAYGLLRLCEKYGAARVDGHCARALSFDVLDVGRIERMLKDARRVESEGESSGKVIALPLGRFARDPSVFATRTSRAGLPPPPGSIRRRRAPSSRACSSACGSGA